MFIWKTNWTGLSRVYSQQLNEITAAVASASARESSRGGIR